jgi:hypothetical protein
MKSKMGRPKLPDGTTKGVLIGARFSPNESEKVHQAIIKSGQNKSYWIRNILLSASNAP